MNFYKRGQSVLEYSILIAVILSALVIMQFYIKRGYQGRLKKEADTVGQQYSPGHTASTININTTSSSQTTVEEGQTKVTVSGRSTTTKNESIDSFSKE